jgi:hypothetical protein
MPNPTSPSKREVTRHELDAHYSECRGVRSIWHLVCNHCDFMASPVFSMGNFGRVANMRKRMREHVRDKHIAALEAK